MCNPTALVIASMVISVAGTVYNSYEADQAAKDQEKYIEDQMEAERKAREKEATAQYNQLAMEGSQAEDAAAEASMDRQIAMKREFATQVVGSGERGLQIGGNTIGQLLREVEFNANLDQSRIERNRDNQLQQVRYEQDNAWRRAEMVGDGPYVANPGFDYLGTGLQIGAGVMNSVGNYPTYQKFANSFKSPTTETP